MSVLSQKELAELNPEKIYQLPFVLNYQLWQKLDTTLLACLDKPTKVQFDANINSSLPDKKGIYMFFVEPEFPFVPETRYLLYVGKVTKKNTFKKRFYEYVGGIGNKNIRRNIQLLTNLFPGKTWVYVYELDLTDQEITKIEQNIYDHVVPPLNNDFKLKGAKNSRSLYN